MVLHLRVEVWHVFREVLNKTNGTWKCKVCYSKATTLYREFGTWPKSDFQSASLLERQAFMREAGSKDKLALIRSAKVLMTQFERHEAVYEDGGHFLPLCCQASFST